MAIPIVTTEEVANVTKLGNLFGQMSLITIPHARSVSDDPLSMSAGMSLIDIMQAAAARPDWVEEWVQATGYAKTGPVQPELIDEVIHNLSPDSAVTKAREERNSQDDASDLISQLKSVFGDNAHIIELDLSDSDNDDDDSDAHEKLSPEDVVKAHRLVHLAYLGDEFERGVRAMLSKIGTALYLQTGDRDATTMICEGILIGTLLLGAQQNPEWAKTVTDKVTDFGGEDERNKAVLNVIEHFSIKPLSCEAEEAPAS